MRNYEIMFIVNPNTAEEEIDKINGQIEGVITAGGGKVEKIEKMGKRRLAYMVKKFREGSYVLFTIEARWRHRSRSRAPAARHGPGDQVPDRSHGRRHEATRQDQSAPRKSALRAAAAPVPKAAIAAEP